MGSPIRTRPGARWAIALGAFGGLGVGWWLDRFAVTIATHPVHFYAAGASSLAALAGVASVFFGCTLSGRACWLLGIACGFALPELVFAPVDLIVGETAVGWQVLLVLRRSLPFVGLFLGVALARFSAGVGPRCRVPVVVALGVALPVEFMFLLHYARMNGYDQYALPVLLPPLYSAAVVAGCIAAMCAGERPTVPGFPLDGAGR
jgi:hypothetical protein